MSIYAELGLPTLINANATLTRLGGSVMPPEVADAMVSASRHYVDLPAMQRKVGERIAELTRNEAAYVSSGAAAGLVLSAAACVTGTNPAAVYQLPNLDGLKNEVIVHKSHRNGYDHAVRQVGVTLREIGYAGSTAEWELEAAINENTAAIFWFQGAMSGRGDLPLQRVIDIANQHNIPVVVDGAAQLPPISNLWRYTEMGAALAVFSGGKDLRGPQATGLVLGRADLIEAVRMNGNPNHSIGRPMKVGKEELAGSLKAVELYVQGDDEARRHRDEETVASWLARWNEIPGVEAVRSFPNEAGQPLPRAILTIDEDASGISRNEIVTELLNGDPAIEVGARGTNGIAVNPWLLSDDERQIVGERVTAVLSSRNTVPA